ncbi:SpoIIE family protein phosphatase [Alkalicoccobacillus murimartini]|uniref:Negative regulator of sigma-B (Phosphoserine phosphatase) n=1 Tax=Alkalicoccobacillus murimartini TaxID=171685 RepID=A0ABT9YL24_9BACI|nr:SpoIIE family protein phosphatase [Alkalicoccobacillus murimartini]MDQ0208570.1 negative regulator of sigma-B (phosphoserine phosphatase) [Alkalicoccobacillus murimartini]
MVMYTEDKNIEVAVLQRSKNSGEFCGDAHAVIKTDTYVVCAVIDGLGSGEGASKSAQAALRMVEEHHELPVKTIVEMCNRSLLSMRGAVITVVKLVFKDRQISYSNFGNIGFTMYNPNGSTVQPLPTRGYLCGRNEKIKESQFQYDEGTIFVLYSDGVASPPPKRMLLHVTELRENSDAIFDQARYVENDDITLLIGKLR